MSTTKLSHDELWPRAGGWQDPAGERTDLTIVGVPTSRTSLSPTNAHETPAAIRDALRRYSTHIVAAGAPGHRGEETELVLHEALGVADAGDVADPDTEAGEQEAATRIAALSAHANLVVALGGDNACTVPAALGIAMAHGGIENAGLITLDAHHDLRDGRSNGSPVRRLIEMGLNPRRVVQIGRASCRERV